MNVFISYSIRDTEQYILSLLAQRIAESGLTLVTSLDQSDYLGSLSSQVSNEIRNSVLFIGLITKSARELKTARVFSEFKQANLHGKPSLFLIEEGVEVAPWVRTYQNTIWFNRFNIRNSIDVANQRIKNAQSKAQQDNAAAWILGGVAVLALLALLSDEKK
jgi:hypothetical protein